MGLRSRARVELRYKTFKYKLNHLIRIVKKKKFYDHKLAASKNDIKTTWKILNEVLNKRKSKLTCPSCFKSNGELISVACENIRFSSLFTDGDVLRGGTTATQRQRFHTDDVKSVRNPVRSADWSTE